MEERFFEQKGLYYRVNKFEAGRPTVVFVHGLSGSSSAWVLYEKEFEGRYNVLSFDLAGHGKSAKKKDFKKYDTETFAEDFSCLIDFLKINNFILVSHSLGALVALSYVAKHQNKVAGLILLSPHYAPGKMLVARMVKPFLTLFTKIWPKSFIPKVRGRVDYSKYINTGDWNARRMFADIKNTSLPVYLFSTAQSYDFNCEKMLEEIKIPVLVVHGAKDTVFPVRYGLEIAKKIKGAEVEILPFADHIIVLNYHKDVLRAISDFVGKVTRN